MKESFAILVVLVMLLGIATEAQAQRYATFDAYRPQLMQAHIQAVSAQTLLALETAQMRYERIQSKLDSITPESNPQFTAIVSTGGAISSRLRDAQVGSPPLYDLASGYEAALASALRRMQAGQYFDPADADRFLREAQMHVIYLNIHLNHRERQVNYLHNLANRPRVGQGMLRISPTGTYRY